MDGLYQIEVAKISYRGPTPRRCIILPPALKLGITSIVHRTYNWLDEDPSSKKTPYSSYLHYCDLILIITW